MTTTRRGELTRAVSIALALGGSATLVGCGGGSTRAAESAATTPIEEARPVARGPVNVRGEREIRARIGAEGGTLELGNGARLEIPRGALAEEIEVRFFTGEEAREAWNAETKQPLGPVLEVTPPLRAASGTFRLSAPAQRIPDGFEPADLALGHEEEIGNTHLGGATQTRWQMWPARVDGTRFVAELPELTGHRIQFGVSR